MPVVSDPVVLKEFYSNSPHVHRHVDIYEADGETIWLADAPFTAGAVTADWTSSAARRTLDLTLQNMDDDLNFNPGGFWYDKIIKVYRGFKIGNAVYEWQQGEFMIDTIVGVDFPATIEVTGRDYVKKMVQSKLAFTELFSAGQSLDTIISSFAINAGITKIVPFNTGYVLQVDYTFDADTTRWDNASKLATDFAIDMFFDMDGYFHFQPFADPATGPSVFTFKTGQPDGTLIAIKKTIDDTRLFNHIVVAGESNGTVTVTAEAINDNSASHTSTVQIGDRVDRYQSASIVTQDQAQSVADQMLAVNALNEYVCDLDSLCVPWLDVGEIITFLDPKPFQDQPTRFVLAQNTTPLTLDKVTSDVRRVEEISQ